MNLQELKTCKLKDVDIEELISWIERALPLLKKRWEEGDFIPEEFPVFRDLIKDFEE